jgi:transposase
LKVLRSAFPWLRHVFADSAYAGRKLQNALAKLGNWTIEIVRRSDEAKGFVLLPRRWVVEHTLAWLNRNRLVRPPADLDCNVPRLLWHVVERGRVDRRTVDMRHSSGAASLRLADGTSPPSCTANAEGRLPYRRVPVPVWTGRRRDLRTAPMRRKHNG